MRSTSTGQTPLIIKTGSGQGFHLYYRYDGEKRRVDTTKRIDLLGDGGYAVAFPSRGSKAYYEIIQGTLEDLAHLPLMRGAANTNVPHSQPVHEREGPVPPLREGGGRNEELFNRARRLGLQTSTEDELLQAVISINKQFTEPLPLKDVFHIVHSVWKYRLNGTLLVAGCEATAFARASEVNALTRDPDVLVLLMKARIAHHSGKPFALANAMAKSLGWTLRRFRVARRNFIEKGYAQLLRPGGDGPNRPPVVKLR
jgi:hypothetical protein